MQGADASLRQTVLQGYCAAARDLITRYGAVDPAALLAPVGAFLPDPPARCLDIGAGTGTLAAWLAGLGHSVTAVEPVTAFAPEACIPRLDWRKDSLPDLRSISGDYDLILISAVWQHLTPVERHDAMNRCAALLASKGRLVMSLRNGPFACDRPTLPTSVKETCAHADAAGLTLLQGISAPPQQAASAAAGVTWDWVVLCHAP